jgi:DNA-binding response OmpR family regulator
MRILVVDDEPQIVQLCVKILNRAGHVVEGTTQGEDALRLLESGSVDLLVVDYKMPGLHGFEVIRRARALHPALKAVMITGHGTREVVGEALGGGLQGVLVKPFTPDELLQTIGDASSPTQ